MRSSLSSMLQMPEHEDSTKLMQVLLPSVCFSHSLRD